MKQTSFAFGRVAFRRQRLMYQRDGYICADLVNPDRKKVRSPDPYHTGSKNAVADGSFAYCGRDEIDVE